MTSKKGKVPSSMDWRVQRINEIRSFIARAAPNAAEEVKWKKPSNPSGVPTWLDHGIICTGEKYKDKVKLTFAKGASLSDPHHLFNSSLEGKVRRAIDLKQGDTLNEPAFLELVRAAVALNRSNAED